MEVDEPTGKQIQEVIDCYASYWKNYIFRLEDDRRVSHLSRVPAEVAANLYGVEAALELTCFSLRENSAATEAVNASSG